MLITDFKRLCFEECVLIIHQYVFGLDWKKKIELTAREAVYSLM